MARDQLTLWALDDLVNRTVLLHSMLKTQACSADHSIAFILVEWLYTLLQTAPGGIPVVFYTHCEAGCDRTGKCAHIHACIVVHCPRYYYQNAGEASAAYYMTYSGMNVTGAWDRDTVDCGRVPEAMSKNAIQW
jgi:hypothetical protein